MPQRLDVLEHELKRLTGWRYWLPVILVSLVVSLIVAAAVVKLVGDSNKDAIAEARAALAEGQRQGCGPNNVRNALDRKIVGDAIPKLQVAYSAAHPILWCERTYTRTNNGQRRYKLPGQARDCFIRLAFAGHFAHREPFTNPALLRRACQR
jgi:hypothetical protein